MNGVLEPEVKKRLDALSKRIALTERWRILCTRTGMTIRDFDSPTSDSGGDEWTALRSNWWGFACGSRSKVTTSFELKAAIAGGPDLYKCGLLFLDDLPEYNLTKIYKPSDMRWVWKSGLLAGHSALGDGFGISREEAIVEAWLLKYEAIKSFGTVPAKASLFDATTGPDMNDFHDTIKEANVMAEAPAAVPDSASMEKYRQESLLHLQAAQLGWVATRLLGDFGFLLVACMAEGLAILTLAFGHGLSSWIKAPLVVSGMVSLVTIVQALMTFSVRSDMLEKHVKNDPDAAKLCAILGRLDTYLIVSSFLMLGSLAVGMLGLAIGN